MKLEPTGNANKPWGTVFFSDSDCAGDLVSRRSISSFILYVLGIPISSQSQAQKSVTLSSLEAWWLALSEAAIEVIFVIHLLGSVKISVKLPVMVRVDKLPYLRPVISLPHQTKSM